MRNELIEGEQLFGTLASRAAVPSFISLVARGNFPVEQDAKYAAHAAHAVDPLASGCVPTSNRDVTASAYRIDTAVSFPELCAMNRIASVSEPGDEAMDGRGCLERTEGVHCSIRAPFEPWPNGRTVRAMRPNERPVMQCTTGRSGHKMDVPNGQPATCVPSKA